ncbi:MFS general substrate transporter [Aspergillus ruber CBS 135680]|uniref:MFS general substrate transporter n=1 Tax=Aspergillus ruber (strain CBS 135680) TaxID=1388766 RepID=A0A017S5R2_ASPRC|nr:MFS general substrate transporter [Aspergillus ruber CBS 135680]EYE92297.1 MFS general substrate transporter [Aspergillus ruber CBS 135680]
MAMTDDSGVDVMKMRVSDVRDSNFLSLLSPTLQLLPIALRALDPLHLHQPSNLKHLISPYNWSSGYKFTVTAISCISTIFASFAASCYSPGAEQMANEWDVSQEVVIVGVTTFTCGFAVGPMFLAPFSEINGRKPVYVGTAILFTVCQLYCAVCRSFTGMLVARFWAGIGGSTFSTMVGGIVADIYPAQKRNTPMACFSSAALFGTGLGPLVCGFIAEYTTWRWIFCIQIIVGGMISCAVILFFRETRVTVVLRKKAKLLNQLMEKLEAAGVYSVQVSAEIDREDGPSEKTMRIRWKIGAEEKQANFATMIQTSLLRPFQLLFTEPVSVLYIKLSVIPLIFEKTYGFSLSDSNTIFAASCTGTLLMTTISILQEQLATRQKGWNSVPEHRLYFSCVESICLPIGLFIFGWTPHYHVHWIVPAIGVCISTAGIFSVYLSVFNYLTDTYHQYASSALAAQSFCRNMLGGVFPLVSRQLFSNLTYRPAGSLLGGIGATLTLVPWVLVFMGRRFVRIAS